MATSPEVQQLSSELQQLTRALQGLVSASSRTAAAQFEALIDTKDQLSKYRKELTQGQNLNKQQRQQIQEAMKAKRDEITAARKLIEANNKLEALRRKQGVSATELTRAQTTVAKASSVHAEAQERSSAAASAVKGSFDTLDRSSKYLNASFVWFTQSIRTQGQQLLAQNKAASGVIEGSGSVLKNLFGQQMDALKFGLSGSEVAGITAANRQMINAVGGTDAALTEFEGAIRRNTILTGSFSQGMELALMSATELAKKGVTPTGAALERFTNDVVELQMRTGKSTKDAIAYLNDIASDESSIELLRRARKEERESILASQRALVRQALALGMSEEQAKEAAKALNKMAAAKPLDRLKQAAKVRAFGGAMGISGAEEAARAMMKANPNAEEQQAILRFKNQAANAVNAAAQQGMPMEIFATSLVDKLGLEQYLGQGNPFSTSIDALKPKFDDMTKVYTDVSKTAEGQRAEMLARLAEQANLIITGNNWLGTVAATAGLILTMIAGKSVVGKVGSAFGNVAKSIPGVGNLMGKVGGALGSATPAATTVASGGKAALGAAGATAGTASKVLGAAGSVLKGASILGTVGSAGSTVYDLAQGKRQESLDPLDLLSPARVGAYIGENLINKPFEAIVGDSIGGKLYDWLNKGKFNDLTTTTQLPSTSPTSSKRPDIVNEAIAKSAEAGEAMKTSTATTATAAVQQVTKLDTSNTLLTQIVDISKRQVDIAEKQLIAMTLSEQERASARPALRSDNRFGAKYGYV